MVPLKYFNVCVSIAHLQYFIFSKAALEQLCSNGFTIQKNISALSQRLICLNTEEDDIKFSPWCPLECDLNGSVRDRVSSSRTRFWTLLNLNSEVSEPKILLFSYWFFMQIRHRTLPNLNLEVSNSTIFSNISFIPNIWKLN